MRVSKFNESRIAKEVQRDTNLPLDWAEPIVLSGFSRNRGYARYDVRISVGGVQHYVGTAYSQKSAALLYDMALWRICPKLAKLRQPNFPREFYGLTQGQVDEALPGIGKFYDRVPHLSEEDKGRTDDELRARWLSDLRAPTKQETTPFDPYRNLLQYLKALSLRQRELMLQLERRREKVRRLEVLPSALVAYDQVLAASATLTRAQEQLAESLANQKDYYEKEIIAEKSLA